MTTKSIFTKNNQNEILCSVVSSDPPPEHLHEIFSEEASLENMFLNV